MSIGRLLERQGRRDEARTMLAMIYNWFTEGFDTADLKDAKTLLNELSGWRLSLIGAYSGSLQRRSRALALQGAVELSGIQIRSEGKGVTDMPFILRDRRISDSARSSRYMLDSLCREPSRCPFASDIRPVMHSPMQQEFLGSLRMSRVRSALAYPGPEKDCLSDQRQLDQAAGVHAARPLENLQWRFHALLDSQCNAEDPLLARARKNGRLFYCQRGSAEPSLPAG
jgi:hypothetical protein